MVSDNWDSDNWVLANLVLDNLALASWDSDNQDLVVLEATTRQAQRLVSQHLALPTSPTTHLHLALLTRPHLHLAKAGLDKNQLLNLHHLAKHQQTPTPTKALEPLNRHKHPLLANQGSVQPNQVLLAAASLNLQHQHLAKPLPSQRKTHLLQPNLPTLQVQLKQVQQTTNPILQGLEGSPVLQVTLCPLELLQQQHQHNKLHKPALLQALAMFILTHTTNASSSLVLFLKYLLHPRYVDEQQTTYRQLPQHTQQRSITLPLSL